MKPERKNQCFIYIRRLSLPSHPAGHKVDNIFLQINYLWHWILRIGILKINSIGSGPPRSSQTVICPLARLYNLTLLFSDFSLIKLIKIQNLLVNISCTWGIWFHILMMSQNVLIKLHILLICCDIFLPTVLPAQGSGWCELHGVDALCANWTVQLHWGTGVLSTDWSE